MRSALEDWKSHSIGMSLSVPFLVPEAWSDQSKPPPLTTISEASVHVKVSSHLRHTTHWNDRMYRHTQRPVENNNAATRATISPVENGSTPTAPRNRFLLGYICIDDLYNLYLLRDCRSLAEGTSRCSVVHPLWYCRSHPGGRVEVGWGEHGIIRHQGGCARGRRAHSKLMLCALPILIHRRSSEAILESAMVGLHIHPTLTITIRTLSRRNGHSQGLPAPIPPLQVPSFSVPHDSCMRCSHDARRVVLHTTA